MTPFITRSFLFAHLSKVDCKYYGAIMTMWNSAALAKDGNNIALKVGVVAWLVRHSANGYPPVEP